MLHDWLPIYRAGEVFVRKVFAVISHLLGVKMPESLGEVMPPQIDCLLGESKLTLVKVLDRGMIEGPLNEELEVILRAGRSRLRHRSRAVGGR